MFFRKKIGKLTSYEMINLVSLKILALEQGQNCKCHKGYKNHKGSRDGPQ